MYICVCMCVCMYICVCVRMCVYVYVYICVHIYVCIYIWIYIYDTIFFRMGVHTLFSLEWVFTPYVHRATLHLYFLCWGSPSFSLLLFLPLGLGWNRLVCTPIHKLTHNPPKKSGGVLQISPMTHAESPQNLGITWTFNRL